jgi:hypothetical protein
VDYVNDFRHMKWFERRIRRYEHKRWAEEPNRRALPFAWGLEHIGGSEHNQDPRVYLDRFAEEVVAASSDWFATAPADDYRLEGPGEAPGEAGVLTFTSAIESPWCGNNRVHGRFFPAKKSGPAVVVIAQWNAGWNDHINICRYLNNWGLSTLRLSLPYHDRRAIPGHPRADHLVGPNIGLTLQANRQAVCDVRRCLRWLKQSGYDRLGLLGTSIGSCIGFITLAHEPILRAGAFLHVSAHFGDVVATGLTTMNVWESLKSNVSRDEIKKFWAPISPFPYVQRLHGSGQKVLAISGSYDPTFWPEYTTEFSKAVHANGLRVEWLSMPCGHYSLAAPPFKYIAGLRFGAFLFEALS